VPIILRLIERLAAGTRKRLHLSPPGIRP